MQHFVSPFAPSSSVSSEVTSDTGESEDRAHRLRRCCDKARNDKASQLNLRSEVLREILQRPDMADHQTAARIALVGVRREQLEIEREMR